MKHKSKNGEILTENVTDNLLHELEFELEQSRAIQAKRCERNAPFIAYKKSSGQWCIVQGCCNSWHCPRCGQIRARKEYGRIVNGAKVLAESGENLYFVTITCRGKELDLSTSDDNYLLWTNRLLSTWRARTKKQGDTWAYVQVTERQERGAAHSHMVVTSFPDDFVPYEKGSLLPNGVVAKHDCLYSTWFVKSNMSAGLGKICDCTIIRSPIAVAVYDSKYLFKEVQETIWPAHWRRVRYSRSWPKLEHEGESEGFPIVRFSDWVRVANLPGSVLALDTVSYERALSALCQNVLPPKEQDAKEYVEVVIDTVTDEF